jgi:RES domain-containing protein
LQGPRIAAALYRINQAREHFVCLNSSVTLKAVGDAWARAGRSAVLVAPSVLIPAELNYLLNPVHPAFSRLEIDQPADFTFDPRLLA